MEDINVQEESKDVQTEDNAVQTENTEAQVVEKETPVCRSAEVLRNLGLAFWVLFYMLAIALICCLVALAQVEISFIVFISIISSMFSCIIFWAFANAVADIAENTFRMAHK